MQQGMLKNPFTHKKNGSGEKVRKTANMRR
jgi:hypothetical protein